MTCTFAHFLLPLMLLSHFCILSQHLAHFCKIFKLKFCLRVNCCSFIFSPLCIWFNLSIDEVLSVTCIAVVVVVVVWCIMLSCLNTDKIVAFNDGTSVVGGAITVVVVAWWIMWYCIIYVRKDAVVVAVAVAIGVVCSMLLLSRKNVPLFIVTVRLFFEA